MKNIKNLTSRIIITSSLMLISGYIIFEVSEMVVANTKQRIEVKQEVFNKTIFSSIKKLQPKLDNKTCIHITKEITKYSKLSKIPSILLVSIIFVESGFNQMATSKTGAIGLMQIMYSVWKKSPELKHVGTLYKLYQIDNNIIAGTNILKKLIIKNKGNVEEALYSYLGKDNKLYYEKIMKIAGEITVMVN